MNAEQEAWLARVAGVVLGPSPGQPLASLSTAAAAIARPDDNFAGYVAACHPDQWDHLRMAFPVELAKLLDLHKAIVARTTSQELYARYRQKVLGEPVKGYQALPTELRQLIGEQLLDVHCRNALFRTSRSEYAILGAAVEGDRLTSMIEKSQSLTALQERLDEIIALAKEEGYRSSLQTRSMETLCARLTAVGGEDDERATLFDNILASLRPPKPVLLGRFHVRPFIALAGRIGDWPQERRQSVHEKIVQAVEQIAADQRAWLLTVLAVTIDVLPEGPARTQAYKVTLEAAGRVLEDQRAELLTVLASVIFALPEGSARTQAHNATLEAAGQIPADQRAGVLKILVVQVGVLNEGRTEGEHQDLWGAHAA